MVSTKSDLTATIVLNKILLASAPSLNLWIAAHYEMSVGGFKEEYDKFGWIGFINKSVNATF